MTSKVWNNFYAPEAVQLCLDKILADMEVDYLDLFLAHWPVAFQPTSFEDLKQARAEGNLSMAEKGIAIHSNGGEIIDWEHTSAPIAQEAGHPEGSFLPTWNAMKKIVATGKVRAIGVSNFGIADLKAILPHAEDVTVSCNQIEVHPWLPNIEVISFARDHGIVTSCFSPFAGQKKDNSTLIHDSTVHKLAKKNDMDVGQLLQSWAVQRGTVPLGKSQCEGQYLVFTLACNAEFKAARIQSNLAIRRLSDEDMKTLDDLAIPDSKGRTIDFTEEWGVKLYKN